MHRLFTKYARLARAYGLHLGGVQHDKPLQSGYGPLQSVHNRSQALLRELLVVTKELGSAHALECRAGASFPTHGQLSLQEGLAHVPVFLIIQQAIAYPGVKGLPLVPANAGAIFHDPVDLIRVHPKVGLNPNGVKLVEIHFIIDS
jgi:hypothetical protein